MEASLFDNLDVAALRALLGAGADSAVVDSALRQTPLHVNCKDGKLDCVAELLSHGANPNARDKFGWTPLLAAVADKYLDDRVREDMVTLLLQHGADPTIVADGGHYKTKRGASVACAGRSAAEVAAALGLRGVSRLLEEERSVRAAPPVAAAAAAAPTPSAELSAFLEGTLPGAAAGAVAGYGAALAGAGAATVDDLRFVEDAVMDACIGVAVHRSRVKAALRGAASSAPAPPPPTTAPAPPQPTTADLAAQISLLGRKMERVDIKMDRVSEALDGGGLGGGGGGGGGGVSQVPPAATPADGRVIEMLSHLTEVTSTITRELREHTAASAAAAAAAAAPPF